MKVAHLALQYGLANTGGATIAATRLHRGLLAHGVESHYICVYQREPGVNVHVLPCGVVRQLFQLALKIARCIWKLTPYRMSVCLNVVPLFGLEKLLAKIDPDVVHVQWINTDTCSFEQVARLPYKVVFNLHDLFLLNAIQAHPRMDNRFARGFDCLNSTRLERWLFGRKMKMMRRLKPVFVGPSQWVCDECRRSIVGRGFPAFAISNIIDERYWAVESARFKRNEKFVILFGAYGGRRNSGKGFADLAHAITLLPASMKHKCELRIFGESSEVCETNGIKTRFLGEIKSVDQMIDAFCEGDIYAFPSHEETQGMSKVEAMLCGLPVIAFNRSACAEGIDDRETGWIAEDVPGFASGLQYFYERWKNGTIDRCQILGMARNRYNVEGLLRRIMDVYQGANDDCCSVGHKVIKYNDKYRRGDRW